MSAKGALPKLGAVAVLLGGAAIIAAQTLPLFAPCRILYRTHQPVQDSPACQVFYWLGDLCVVLLGFAAVVGVVVAFRYFGRRTSDT
jgi:hypothetical protein